MTNDLVKTFFDTFGIEQKYEDGTCDMDDECRHTDCNTCQRINKFNYPQISDRILLGLIVIIMLHEDLYGYPRNIKDLKENVLKQLMETYNKFSSSSYEYQQTARDIKHQVRTLFEEVNNDR